jgi:hypothetical protein
LHWLVQDTSGIETLDHYLDDFIFVESEFNNNCKILMDTFIYISSELKARAEGIAFAQKAMKPTTDYKSFNLIFFTLTMDWIPALSLHNLSAGIFTTMSNVSISRPRNVKNVVINPSDFDLMGIIFCDMHYVDKCLPLGCASSCQLFERFSSFLHWLVQYTSGNVI